MHGPSSHQNEVVYCYNLRGRISANSEYLKEVMIEIGFVQWY
jgi:hypothetical protein